MSKTELVSSYDTLGLPPFAVNYDKADDITRRAAVEIEWILDTPVREDLYQYILNG